MKLRAKIRRLAVLVGALGLGLGVSTGAQAVVVWDWSFASTSGQLVTDGIDYSAGTYNLIDFSVTSSDVASIGSTSGGQYSPSGFLTNLPYSMVWDGGSITKWDSAGSNSFDWWVFQDLLAVSTSYIFFGWETGNINTVNHAAYFSPPCCSTPSFLLTVRPATLVPEPSTLGMLGMGLVALGFAVRRRLS